MFIVSSGKSFRHSDQIGRCNSLKQANELVEKELSKEKVYPERMRRGQCDNRIIIICDYGKVTKYYFIEEIEGDE